MKEQLANMTIIELVRTAHSYAASIQTIETYSAIVTEMGSRLEALNLAHIAAMNNLRSATSTNDNLTAENVALLNPQTWLQHSEEGEVAAAIADGNGASEQDALLAGMKAIIGNIETPATDRFLAEQRAVGVEMFAAHIGDLANSMSAATAEKMKSIVLQGLQFAAQLRNEVNHG